jgi:arylsulfatase
VGVRRTLVAAAIAALVAHCADAKARPNILLVTVDTLRADALACYGGDPEVGRAACAVADGGTRYTWAFSTAPSTAPSVASILTSRYPSQHGVDELAVTLLEDGASTVAEAFEAAGYATAAFVSNPVLARARRLDQGFAIYDDRMTDREANRKVGEREAAATTDAALAWARVARAPIFLWVHYQDPHGPYAPPGAPPQADAPGAEALPVLRDHSGRGGIPAYQALPGLRSAPAYSARYRAEITYLDQHLARLVAGLEALGPPLGIALTADHGEAFGEDGYWLAHGHSVGLDQIRVPLLVRPPASAAAGTAGGSSGTVELPVSTLDVAPTLLRLAGIEPPPAFEGRALPVGTASAAETAEIAGRPLFAEHRLRIAVVAGSAYYARDRQPIATPVPDRVSGGELGPLPVRAARLGSDPRLPAYEAAGGGNPLEEIASRFTSRGAMAGAPRIELSPAERERLRALGYLE